MFLVSLSALLAAAAASLLRLALRAFCLRRRLWSHHGLRRPAGALRRSAALYPGFAVATRTGVESTRSLRRALDPRFAIAMRRSSIEALGSLWRTLDSRFAIAVRRSGVQALGSLRCALDTRFAIAAGRSGVEAFGALRPMLDACVTVAARRSGIQSFSTLRRTALDTRFSVGTGVEPFGTLRRAAVDSRFPAACAANRGHGRRWSRRRGKVWDAVIHRRKLRTLEAGRALMPLLDRRQSHVPFVPR
jgi:hypothetical protein